jgi:hypothetical protein
MTNRIYRDDQQDIIKHRNTPRLLYVYESTYLRQHKTPNTVVPAGHISFINFNSNIMMVFDDRNACASSIPMEQLATALTSNRTTNSPASRRKNFVTCMQKIGSSNDVFFKDPDCAPSPYNKKKTVMFTTNLASISGTSAHCVSATKHSEVWYTSKELAEISNLARQSAWMSEAETNEDESFRGLEDSLSIRASQAMKGRKIGVALAVLNEQARQRTIGVSDTKRIKMKSKMASRKSRTLAIERAEQDAKEASETEVASPRLTETSKGLPNYSSRKNTRTNSVRRLSSFDARKLADLSVPVSSRKLLGLQQL